MQSQQRDAQVIWLSLHSLLPEPSQTVWFSWNENIGIRGIIKEHLLGSPRPVTAEPLPSTASGRWRWPAASLGLCFSCHRWGLLGSSQLVANVIALGAHVIVMLTSTAKAAVVPLLGKDPLLSSANG